MAKANTTIKQGEGELDLLLNQRGRRWLDSLTAQQGEEEFGQLDGLMGGMGGKGGRTD